MRDRIKAMVKALVVGETYKIRWQTSDGPVLVPMTLMGIYRYGGLFETERGVREFYNWPELVERKA